MKNKILLLFLSVLSFSNLDMAIAGQTVNITLYNETSSTAYTPTEGEGLESFSPLLKPNPVILRKLSPGDSYSISLTGPETTANFSNAVAYMGNDIPSSHFYITIAFDAQGNFKAINCSSSSTIICTTSGAADTGLTVKISSR